MALPIGNDKLVAAGVTIQLDTDEYLHTNTVTIRFDCDPRPVQHVHVFELSEMIRGTCDVTLELLLFIPRHIPALTLNEIIAMAHLEWSWRVIHSKTDPVELPRMYAALNNAGLTVND